MLGFACGGKEKYFKIANMCSLVCLILIIDNTRHTYVVRIHMYNVYLCKFENTCTCISKSQEKENLRVNVIVHVSVNAII